MQVGGVHVPWLESLMESRVQRDAAHTDIKAMMRHQGVRPVVVENAHMLGVFLQAHSVEELGRGQVLAHDVLERSIIANAVCTYECMHVSMYTHACIQQCMHPAMHKASRQTCIHGSLCLSGSPVDVVGVDLESPKVHAFGIVGVVAQCVHEGTVRAQGVDVARVQSE